MEPHYSFKQWESLIIAVILIVGIPAGIIFRGRRARRRREELDRFALLKGFSRLAQHEGVFHPGGEPWMNCYLFLAMHASRREFLNVFRGRTDGREWIFFDFLLKPPFLMKSGANYYTGAAVEFAGKKIPSFVMFERTLWASAGPYPSEPIHLPSSDFPRKNDISSGDEAFDSKYSVQGTDPEAVRALFGPELRRALLENPRTWYVEGTGDWLIIYHSMNIGHLPPEQDFMDIGAVARSFSTAIKS